MASKNRILFVLSIIFWILAIFSVIEISSRFIFPYNMSLREVTRCSFNPEIIFELNPNTKTVFTGQHVKIPPTTIKISSQGIRDYEYSVNKPEGVYRIIILGDSIAFGMGVELEQTFAKYLELMLNEGGAKKYEVINFSVPGYNTVQEVATLESKCLAYKPDLVIIAICGNDYQPAFNYLYPFSFLKYIPDYFYKSRFVSGIIGECVFRKSIAYSRKTKQGTAELDQAIGKLRGLISENNIKVLFHQGDERRIRDILIKYGFSDNIVNSDRNVLSQDEYIIKKDRHYSAKGQKKIAEDICHFLKTKDYYIER